MADEEVQKNDAPMTAGQMLAPPAPSPPAPAPLTVASAASKDPNIGGGSVGAIPMMNNGMQFRDIGSYGLRAFSGWVREEFLPQLTGRQGAQKYREMLDNSPIVGAIMFALTGIMRKVEWRVEPVDDSGPAKEAAQFVESCMHDMSHTWEDFIVETLSMLGYGFAPHEIVYKKRNGRDVPDSEAKSDYDDGRVGWRRMPIRGQDTVIKWFFDANGQIKGLTQQPWMGSLLDIPIEKLLLFRPSQHKNNPEGRSVLRTAYVPYYFTKRMQEQEAIMGERLGGFPVVRVPQALIEAAAAGQDSAVAALAVYQKMALNVRVDEQMGAVLPSDTFMGANGPTDKRMYDFELLTPSGGGSGKSFSFDTAIQRYNNLIFSSVLADFVQMGHSARGAQNLAETKVDLFYGAIEGFLNSNAAVINRHALPRLWALNGMDANLMPEIVPDLAQRIDLDALSNFVLRLSQSGMPLFPNEELQTFLLDAGGLPDMVDPMSMQAAGLLDEQLDRQDEKDQASLDAMNNPQPTPQSPLQKMLLASLARRILKARGQSAAPVRKRRRNPYAHKHG